MHASKIFPIFVAVWVLIAIATSLLHLRGSLETKRRWHPRITVAVGVLFLAFVASVAPARALYLVVPAVALITYLNLKVIRFCSACGATLRQAGFRAPVHCSRCGAKL
jgi:hypothetical protein